MKEYIEKETARAELIINDELYAADIVKAIPAADVVEVRHARWAGGAFGYGHYWCTYCQKDVWSEEEKTNYCPRCGAKMDGGADK